jgi:hypothetical protein
MEVDGRFAFHLDVFLMCLCWVLGVGCLLRTDSAISHLARPSFSSPISKFFDAAAC